MNIIPKVALRCSLILGVAILCRPSTLNETPTNVAKKIFGGDCTPIKTKTCGGELNCTLTTIIDLSGEEEVPASSYVEATCGLPSEETCDTTNRLIPVACSGG